VCFDEALCNCKTESRTSSIAAAGWIATKEALENSLRLTGCDTASGIKDAKAQESPDFNNCP